MTENPFERKRVWHSGICIGGPLAGRYQALDRNYFEAAVLPSLPVPIYNELEAKPVDLTFRRVAYEWREIGDKKTGLPWGFWVYHELKGWEAIWAELVRHYRPDALPQEERS